jgi:hypothetical protein
MRGVKVPTPFVGFKQYCPLGQISKSKKTQKSFPRVFDFLLGSKMNIFFY